MAAPFLRADALFAAWARQEWKKVYLFAGTEDFLIDEAVARLAAAKLTIPRPVRPPHPAPSPSRGEGGGEGGLSERSAWPGGGVNHDRLDGERASAEAILEVCCTMPFAGPARVVEVQNTYRLASDHQRRLAEGMTRLPESAHLILIWGKDWRREDAERPLVKAISKAGAVVIFWPLFPDQIQRWAAQRAKRYQKSLAPEAARWLAQETEQGLRYLDQELQKICCYVGDRPVITLEDAQEASGYPRAASPYVWIDAVRQKDPSRALQALDRLLEEGEEPIRLLSMVSGSVRDWLGAKGMLEGSQRSEQELLEGLSDCVNAQLEVKTGKENPEMALTLLTLRLCGLEDAYAGR